MAIKLLIGGSPCEWKSVVGYEGVYEVSSDGNVRRKGGKVLKPKIEGNGYVRYHLSKNGVAKSILAHRIVALAFLDNPHNYTTVNHKDENKTNNSVDNLEWCDMSYQNKYGIGAVNRNKFKEKSVLQLTIKGELIRKFDSVKKAAIEVGVNETSIHCVCKGIRRFKTAGGYMWKYTSEVE